MSDSYDLLNTIDEFLTNVANGLFADVGVKEGTRKHMIQLMYIACKKYHYDDNFRKIMDEYSKHFK